MRKALTAKAFGRKIELQLLDPVILVEGDSGTGKTLIYNVFKDISALDKNILCINADVLRIAKKTFKQYKAGIKGKVILVDNADIILTSDARKSLLYDTENQYVIFGRNSDGLGVTEMSFTELKDNGSNIKLVYKHAPKIMKKVELP